ncbi:MAG TPA: universal stress protein [Puia sp.]|nr:universal stress protein [Puia sp.]
MRTLLILTDFSESSFRAAEYGCSLAGILHIQRIILYHSYSTVIPTTDIPVSDVKTNQQIYLESMQALALLQDRLRTQVDPAVTIELLSEDVFLPEGIDRLCRKKAVDLVVLGASGSSGFERAVMGSTTARLLADPCVPLLIVPAETPIGRGIKTIAFAADLRNIPHLPVVQLYLFLDALRAEICVVNVEPSADEGKYFPEKKQALLDLHHLLDKYHPSFYDVEGEDVADSILAFADGHKASLIIVVPGTHHYLSSIFHKTVSKRLAYRSTVPLLALSAAK